MVFACFLFFFFSSRRRHTRCSRDWSSDVCSSDLVGEQHKFLPVRCWERSIIALRSSTNEKFPSNGDLNSPIGQGCLGAQDRGRNLTGGELVESGEIDVEAELLCEPAYEYHH